MAKQSGLGANFYIGGYNISGDVGSVGTISGGPAALEVTAIDKSAYERIGGQRNGTIEFSTFFNASAGQEHAILKTRPTADTQVMYLQGTTRGSEAACMTAKQINYDFTRAADGSLTTAVQAQSNGFGLEWGVQLTNGGMAVSGTVSGSTSIDTAASLAFGAQAYLQVSAFTGTDATVTIQDSADDSAFANVTGLSFTQVTAAPTFERVATSNTATIRRYVRFVITTSGGLTSMTYAIVFVKNPIASQTF